MATPKWVRILGCIALPVLLALPALADQLPTNGHYGNERGCASLVNQEEFNDSGILVTSQNVKFYESGCDFLQVLTGSYGRSVVTALCSGEGEEWVSTYLVTPDIDDPAALHFRRQGSDEFQFTVSKCD